MHLHLTTLVPMMLIQLVVAGILDVLRRRGVFPSKKARSKALVGLELMILVPLLPAIDRIRASPPSDYFEAGWFAISLVCAFAGALVLVGALSLKSKERGDCG